MIVVNFDLWRGYRFGNKLLGVNNLIQISNVFKQDYFFTKFDGLDIFDIITQTKDYDSQSCEILDITKLIENKESLTLDNDKYYTFNPCLFEFFYDFSDLSTFDIFKVKKPYVSDKTKVAVHFRGTDFFEWDSNCILSHEYYINSIKYVLEESNNTSIYLFTDDNNLQSLNLTKDWLTTQKINYNLGSISNYMDDFISISLSDYVISSPSTFCITASFCGKKNKKIIHSKDFIEGYKLKSNYYRDVFWKKLYYNSDNTDYKIYKLI